ncbi:hypothetical protein K439DRAFT_513193 [Ramaria rubella]|nr:hypothetical protein K439DRAFT_513193 [Ramaria rubella]
MKQTSISTCSGPSIRVFSLFLTGVLMFTELATKVIGASLPVFSPLARRLLSSTHTAMQSTNVKSLTTRSLCALSGMVGASLRLWATTPCLIAATVFDSLSLALSAQLSYSENNLSDPLGRSRHTLGLGLEVIFGVLARSYKGSRKHARTVEDCDVRSFWYRWSVIEDRDVVAMQDFYYSFQSDLDYLWDWYNSRYSVTISLCEARSNLLGHVKWLPHLALNVVLRTPRHTLLEILTSPMTLNIGRLVSATFGIVGVLLGTKETLPFQLAGLLCAISSFICSFIISVCAAGVPDFPDDLTGIASFGEVLLRVWTIKRADKSGHGV